MDAGYRGEGKGADWARKAPGWTVDPVERPRKPAPEEVLMGWAREWAKEGVAMDRRKLLPPKGFVVLPRRWVVERALSWIDQNRRMSKDYERLCASGEASVYAAMIRLMRRRLARVWGLFIQPRKENSRKSISKILYWSRLPWRIGRASPGPTCFCDTTFRGAG